MLQKDLIPEGGDGEGVPRGATGELLKEDLIPKEGDGEGVPGGATGELLKDDLIPQRGDGEAILGEGMEDSVPEGGPGAVAVPVGEPPEGIPEGLRRGEEVPEGERTLGRLGAGRGLEQNPDTGGPRQFGLRSLKQNPDTGGPRALLSSGEMIPLLGFGTWGLKQNSAGAAVATALDAGVRHFDCAPIYGNEELVGEQIDQVLRTGKVRFDISIVYVYIVCVHFLNAVLVILTARLFMETLT